MSSYWQQVRGVQNGEAVDASVANRPIDALRNNDAFLREVLENLVRTGAVIDYGRPMSSDTVAGTPVYWDADAVEYKPALMALEVDDASGGLKLATTSRMDGLVLEKAGSRIGHVLVMGVADLDLSAVCESADLGNFTLSATAGKLSLATQPGQPVVVRRLTSSRCLVLPLLKSFEVAHAHARFSLVCAPAGTYVAPGVGDPHSISAPDAETAGWLPADHASFDGAAPAGAAFGYNLAAHAELAAWWPPANPGSVVLVWDKGDDADLGGRIVPASLCVVDAAGIWWMSDCYGDVPWPIDYSAGDSDSDDGVCPRELFMTLDLLATTLVADADPSLVTSLRSTDERLKITCRGTDDPAEVGALDIAIEMALEQTDDAANGGLVVKTLDGQTLKRGAVVEGIHTSDPRVQITSTISRPLSDADGAPTVHQGILELSVADAATLELQPTVVKFIGTGAEDTPILSIALLHGPDDDELTGYIAQFEVPDSMPGTLTFKYRARIVGRTAGTLPQLDVEYQRSARPSAGLATPNAAVTVDWTALTMVTVATLASTNQQVEAESSAISVSAGDIVRIKVLRNAADAGDTYGSDVLVAKHVGIVSAA